MVYYREFMISGEGNEVTVNSSRDRPGYILSAPLHIYKFNVKSLELPLSFNPKLQPTEMPFYTTYFIASGGNVVFKDYIAFTQNVQMTGATVAAKIQECLVYHASKSFATHGLIASISSAGVSTSGITNNGANPVTVLGATPTCTIVTTLPNSGALSISVNRATTINISTVDAMTIDFGLRSILAAFMDFQYYSTSAVVNFTVNGGVIANDPALGPTLRTRPAYFFLNSNVRAGFKYHSTARPRESAGNIIAKVHIPMDSATALGDSYSIWVNPSQTEDLMYTCDEASYSSLEFWMTYPDGVTEVTFIGNAFSLTLATLISDTRS